MSPKVQNLNFYWRSQEQFPRDFHDFHLLVESEKQV